MVDFRTILSVILVIGFSLIFFVWFFARRKSVNSSVAQENSDQLSESGADAFETVLIAVEGNRVELASGRTGLLHLLEFLDLPSTTGVEGVVASLRADAAHAGQLDALFYQGRSCDFELGRKTGNASERTLTIEGRVSGLIVWLRLSFSIPSGLPPAPRFATFLESLPYPTWIIDALGHILWTNRAWLEAAEVKTFEDALEKGADFDRHASFQVKDAAETGENKQTIFWATLSGQRRAFQLHASPLEGGGAAAIAVDVTSTEEIREQLRQYTIAHDQTLNRLDDAVVIFGPNQKLTFHNTAFATLWQLEPAWLADSPKHGDILDRLRQRRKLPETADYGRWKMKELSYYEQLDASPDDLWTTPDGKTLRVVRQPHPFGGLLILFSDITDEIRLRAQYNAQAQVQQATLDKLNDAVAVFGSDGRLRLYNEAFERFWHLSHTLMTKASDFDQIAKLCLPLLPDEKLWQEFKARMTDPSPQARAPISGEVKTADRRSVAYQTRPLPDGATLIAFSDITATRELEQAFEERSAALDEAQRLKREFVGNVSYELRTPLTTIMGYAEMLDGMGPELPEQMRRYLTSIRMAAEQLARSIDDVLDMAQIDANEMALSLSDVCVADILAEAREKSVRAASEAGVRLIIEDVSRIGNLRADHSRLVQVLDHLIALALKTTSVGGEVRLYASRNDGVITLKVSDTGRGIPYHIQARIFDRFTSRDHTEPGLSLALVRALIELHGGWVALESTPGQGTTFTCHIPEAGLALINEVS